MGGSFYQTDEDVKPPSQGDQGPPYLSSQTIQEEAHDSSRVSCDDGKGIGQSQRRRTQVACLRCRRRKIKCSGDLGNGEACSNCRSSKSEGCVYLRVNSSPLQTKSHYAAGWTYPPLGPNTPTGRGQQQIAYSSHMARAIAPLHSTALISPPYSMVQPSVEYGTIVEPPPNQRTSYTGYPVAYDEDTAYGISLSSYLSNGSALGAVNVCGNSTAGRVLRPSDRVESCSSTLYSDPEGGNSSALNFSSTTRPSHTSSSIDPNTVMPGMGAPPSGHGRTLPNPTTSRGNSSFPLPGSLVEGQSTINPAATTTALTSTYKPTYHWPLDGDLSGVMACTRMSSKSACSPISFNATPSSSPDADFGYVLSSESYAERPLPGGGKASERLPLPVGWRTPKFFPLAENTALNDSPINSASPIHNSGCC